MTAASPAVTGGAAIAEDSTAERAARRAARIRGVLFAALGLFALQLAISAFDVPARFSFWIDRQGGQAMQLGTSVGVLWIVTGLVTGGIGIWQLYRGAAFRWRRGLAPIVVLWVTATFAALLAGKTANMTGVFQGTLALAAPISLGAFAGIISERSGMANIAIEGKLLIGACVASVVASVVSLQLGPDAGPFMLGVAALIGVIFAALAAALTSLLLAWLGIRWKVDQFIAGIVINFGAVGITNFLFLRVLSKQTKLNTPPSVEAIKLPLLGDLPVIGPILFNQTPYVYVTILVMIAFTYMLFRTRWGLRLRASGEKPSAAGTVGIDVLKIRYRAMLVAGMFAGIGGSALSLASAGSFQMNMSAGRGFIALAAVIFGAWNPVYAFGAALVFGFADSSQALLSILGVDVPPQLLNSVPYIVTIVVVAGVVGRVRGPAAVAQPYDQG
jgi:general nucleoside transport system permease protein